MRRRNFILLLLVIFFLTFSFRLILAEDTVEIVLLHTNDMHGHMFPYEDKKIVEPPEQAGGFQYLATLIKKARRENPGRVLLLDGGDIAQGTIYSNLAKGIPMMELMNYLRYDASVIGNHEFDWGEDKLVNMISAADFPILDSNILLKEEGSFIKGTEPYILKDIEGVRIGIIGIACTEKSVFGPKIDLNAYDFISPEDAMNTYIPILKNVHKADLIIALNHNGFREDKELASSVPGIDVIVGGHSHTVLKEPELVGDTIIVQAGCYTAYLGELKLRYDRGEKEIAGYEGKLIPITDSQIEADPEVVWMLDKYKEKYEAIAREVIGETLVDLNNSKIEEASIGNLFTDIMREYGKSHVALLNSGGIRADIPAGPVTMEKLYEVFPFDNLLVTMDLKGKDLMDILENSFSGKHAILQVSGLYIKCDMTKPEGHHLTEVLINGELLDMDATYRVATADFLALGGDGYDGFKNGENGETVMFIRDAAEEYFRMRSPVSTGVEGRIEIIK